MLTVCDIHLVGITRFFITPKKRFEYVFGIIS